MRNIKRDEMDRYSLESHKLAAKAQEENFFKGEILPIDAVFPNDIAKTLENLVSSGNYDYIVIGSTASLAPVAPRG